METVEKTLQDNSDTLPAGGEGPSRGRPADDRPIMVDPDIEFIRTLRNRLGDSFEKCFQCGTCTATCAISPDAAPFPRRQIARVNWGMRRQLIADPAVWLCYQCNDCTTRCPRTARPGDVLAAIRQECIQQFAFPRFLGRWVNRPQYIPFLLAIPALLLTAALYLKQPLETFFGFAPEAGSRIVFSYSGLFPHWLLNGFFLFFSALVLVAVIVGVSRLWRAMQASDITAALGPPAKGMLPSIGAALKNVITHRDFTECTAARGRFWSHVCIFFGFAALTLVTLWIITAGFNPLMQNDFVYPFAFWSPWKLLANAGGIALLFGCALIIRDRFSEKTETGLGTYFDWAFIAMLALTTLSGFATEVLHYLRLEPHRHIVYFGHLVIVFTLLMYLPYSKFAHLVYRTTALVFAEYRGLTRETPAADSDGRKP